MGAAMPHDFDPLAAALDRAPLGEPWTRERRAELDRAAADIAAGRAELVAHDDVAAWLEARQREGSICLMASSSA